MSRPPSASIFRSSSKTIASVSGTRRRSLKKLSGTSAGRAGAFLALFAIIATVFYAGTSSAASPSAKVAPESSQASARQPVANYNFGAWLLPPMMFQTSPPLVETISTYAADCSTPKTDFDLGQQVCVRATFPSAFLSFRRLTLIGPAGNVLGSVIVTSSTQTNVFTLPGTATSVFGEETVDNRGTWRVDLRSFGGSRRATAAFDVHEPANPIADLQIAAVADETVETSSTVQIKVVVYNAGPDTATNVKVSAPSVAGLSLQSFDQGGPDCGSTCTLASIAPRGHAVFAATYSVTAAAGTIVGSQVTVASDTEDPRPGNNIDKFGFKVAAATGQTQTCNLTPPAPISVNGSTFTDPNDPTETLYGAVVTYSVGAEGESCEPVFCDSPSGSFFPVGKTNVTCTAASGDFTIFPVTVLDTRAFKIDLIGANPLTAECHGLPPFADPGATTNRPGVTPTAVSTVNPNVPGSYTITYSATDNKGTADTSDDVTATPVVRTVNVVDDAPPQITLVGDDPTTDEIETQELTVECHTGFTDPGATVIDACDGAVPLIVTGTVDPNTVGVYTITYSATDKQGTPNDTSDDLIAEITRTIHVVDTTAPVIALNGANPMTVECHTPFTDPGASATDSCDTTTPVTATGSVDPNTPGTYQITYTASDDSGNTATPVTRTVNVVDTTGPAITLNGNSTVTVECHTSYTDAGATAFDACGNAAVPVNTSGSVNVNTVGTYTITYTATDGTTSSTKTRTVNVVDTTKPIITLNGANSMTVECHTSFNDPGATATDSCDSSVPVTTSGSVNVDAPGTYTVTYNASDDSGNAATAATRTVTVVDTTKPVITLNDPNLTTVECHTSFTDPGAIATDSCDSSVPVTATGSVNVNVPGTYTITYTASDDSGNAATPATRTVTVRDTTKPVIALSGASTMTVECHTGFTDPGASATDSCDSSVPVASSGSVNANVVGTYTITYTASDDSGNAAVPVTRTVNVVDTTAPTINCPADIVVNLPANSSATSMPVNFNVTASDSCSTTATVTTSQASGSNFPVGTTTVTATATDPSGNSSTCTFHVTVHYLFTGFFSPISNLPTVNLVKAGSAIPIKFSLSGNKGLNIFATDYPASGPVGCNSSDPAVDLSEIDTTGNSTLTYDAGSGQYHYNWKTLKAWENTCRQLVVKLNDGTEHRANFKFK